MEEWEQGIIHRGALKKEVIERKVSEGHEAWEVVVKLLVQSVVVSNNRYSLTVTPLRVMQGYELEPRLQDT